MTLREFYNTQLEGFKKYMDGNNGRVNQTISTLSTICECFADPACGPMQVLDVGCAIGMTSKAMAERGARVTAIDIADKLIDYAKEANAHENIDYQVVSFEEYAPLDGDQRIVKHSFDMIVFSDSLEHMTSSPDHCSASLEDVFRKIYLLLKEDYGLIYVNIPHYAFLQWLRKNRPGLLQPQDESISVAEILRCADWCGSEENPLCLYGIQTYGVDIPGNQYVEIVLVRRANLEKFYEAFFRFQDQQKQKSQQVPDEEQKED